MADKGIADGDEIATWRVERVEKDTCFAGGKPTIFVEHFFAVVAEISQYFEVLKQIDFAIYECGR